MRPRPYFFSRKRNGAGLQLPDIDATTWASRALRVWSKPPHKCAVENSEGPALPVMADEALASYHFY